MKPGSEVVLVTGASGFLGQHIVELLQLKDDDVVEIRAFDTKPFRNTLGYEEKKPVLPIVGDVRNMDALVQACEGVDCVIHAAALIDVAATPDVEAMRQVNIKGTENVIKACLETFVPHLVFTSTVDVVVGNQDLIYVREHQACIPQRFLMGAYAETKQAAEDLVLQADGTLLGTAGGVLRTLVLRPVVMYGEGDPYFITKTLQSTAQRRGILQRIGDGRSFMQATYVGNAAWAHVVAKKELRKHAEPVAGRAYFITDDTLPCNPFDFLEPFVVARGFQLSTKRMPYWLIWIILTCLSLVHRAISPFYKLPINNIPPVNSITYICKTFVVNRMRSTYRLHYSPLYSTEEAMNRSMVFYKSLKL